MRNELAVIDGIEMKGKKIIIPFQLQKQTLQQLHSNHMGIEKMRNKTGTAVNKVKLVLLCLQQFQFYSLCIQTKIVT